MYALSHTTMLEFIFESPKLEMSHAFISELNQLLMLSFLKSIMVMAPFEEFYGNT